MAGKMGQGGFGAGGSTTPSDIGGATTPPIPMADHSFTLQAIMELQKSNGQLTNAVENMTNALKEQKADIKCLDEKVSSLSHKIYGATAVVLVLMAIGGFMLNAALGLAAARYSNVQPTQTQVLQPAQPPAQQ